MSSKLDNVLYQPLLEKKILIEDLTIEEKNSIFQIARNYLYSGFLLNNIIFHKKDSDLLEKLNRLKKNYIKKSLIMMNSLEELSAELSKRKIDNITMKGIALYKGGYYLNNERQFRDIDLLVRREDLHITYEIAKKFGFKYLNSDTKDTSKYYKNFHHLPLMQNQNHVSLEIHHRVTHPIYYKQCPLTKSFFKNKRYINNIFMPSESDMLVHSLYHGIIHHKCSHGPIFLIDILKLTKDNEDSLENVKKTIEELGLIEFYKDIQNLLIKVKLKNTIDDEILFTIKKILNGFNWNNEEINTKLAFNLKNIISTFKSISHNYQINYFSVKFFKILITRAYKIIKSRLLKIE